MKNDQNVAFARELGHRALNDTLRGKMGRQLVRDCYGERFIGCAMSKEEIVIEGTPGNALGAYLDGAKIAVIGNAQDAVGDTMNDGQIVIHGSAGDALGYAMRGGAIFVRDGAGYRSGIHMKEYESKRPVIVIGGSVGSFLGEYMAGGLIVVLGIGADGQLPIGPFSGTGMHGGMILIRSDHAPNDLPAQVSCHAATLEDIAQMTPWVDQYAKHFSMDAAQLMKGTFYCLTPNAKNPYRQLYTPN